MRAIIHSYIACPIGFGIIMCVQLSFPRRSPIRTQEVSYWVSRPYPSFLSGLYFIRILLCTYPGYATELHVFSHSSWFPIGSTPYDSAYGHRASSLPRCGLLWVLCSRSFAKCSLALRISFQLAHNIHAGFGLRASLIACLGMVGLERLHRSPKESHSTTAQTTRTPLYFLGC